MVEILEWVAPDWDDDVRKILHKQDPEKIDLFIRFISSHVDDLKNGLIDIKRQPFKQFSQHNEYSAEYKQLLDVQKAAKDLANALIACNKDGALDRLSHYLNTPNLDGDTHDVLRIYSATIFALSHQSCTQTKSSYSESQKSILRYLKLLFSRFFPLEPIKYSSEGLIYKIGCRILGRDSLSGRTDESIKLRPLSGSKQKF